MEITFLIGNLTKDPEEIKGMPKSLCKFAVAVNANYTTASGERPVNFHTIIAWGGIADNCVKYLKKGSKVAIVGRLQNRSYEGSDGTTKYVTEIVANEVEFLSKKQEEKTDGLVPVEDEDLPF